MNIIPVIDLKDGVVVHARQGRRDQYQPINTGLCRSSGIFQVIEAYLNLYDFNTFYIADLNALTNRGNHDRLISEVLTRFHRKQFWIDRGYRNNEQRLSPPANYRPVLGSESFREETIRDIKAHENSFILSLDYSAAGAMGAKSLFSNQDYWPDHIIIMTLDRVGSGHGPDLNKLAEFRRKYPDKDFIAAGGIRNKQDLIALKKLGINQALVASALHSGAISRDDIAEFQAKKYPNVLGYFKRP